MTTAEQADSAPSILGGLRARKKAATMRHIQRVALDLFDEHGFDGVTVEEVAAAAEVSPRTIYRYFGTKEQLVLLDELDEPVLDRMLELAERMDLREAFLQALREVGAERLVPDVDTARRRARHMHEVPGVRAAALLAMDQVVQHVAERLVARGRTDPVLTRARVAALFWPIFTGLDAWYASGAEEPPYDLMMRLVEETAPPV